MRAASRATYLDAMDNVLKHRRALGPGAHQLRGPVKVLDVLAVHLEERGQLLQDVPEPGVRVPLWGREVIRETTRARVGRGRPPESMGQRPNSQRCVMVGKPVTLSEPYFPPLYRGGGGGTACYTEVNERITWALVRAQDRGSRPGVPVVMRPLK